MDAPALLVSDPSRVRSELYTRFAHAYPQRGEALFPVGTRTMPPLLIDATVWLYQHCPAPTGERAELPEPVVQRLRAWALDLRRTGFPAHEYPAVAGMIADVAGASQSERAVLAAAGEAMRDAAAAADTAGVAPAAAARVTATDSRGGATVVQCETGAQLHYSPGQTLPVMLAGHQGVWRGLAPAVPANGAGHVEFHLDSEFAPREPQPGDYLTLGAARGPSPALAGARALIVAHGTGLAAAKALVFDLLERPARPQVHLLIGADSPGQFYDVATFKALARSQRWLQVTWAAPNPAPSRGAVGGDPGVPVVGAPLEDLLASPGAWWGSEIVLCGRSQRVEALATSLFAAGAGGEETPITELAYDAAPGWFAPAS